MATIKSNTFISPTTNKQFTYLSAGPTDGPLIFLLHGWPAIGLTWKPQLLAWSSLGFHVVAPDLPGYGGTWTSKDPKDFALEKLVPQILEMFHSLGREQAIWVGHDWGCGPLWAIASHHPEVCQAVVGISVPYRTLEMGLEHLISLIDRQVYPEDEYPWGQWDYQVFYEREPQAVDRQFESEHVEKYIKLVYSRGSAAAGKAPARTARVSKDDGWFGGPAAATQVPDLPLERTVLDEEILQALVASARKNGWHGATAWYLNHKANAEYTAKSVNGGVLKVPILFVHTEYDAVCQTVHNPRFMVEMRGKCERLCEVVVKAGHWGALECKEEVNAAVVEWITKEVTDCWPGPVLKSRI
ncbi:Alpha/Beta hydrolase protein [Exophiala viscosa]|uniref:Alpha/Beta hydrolase protein n=1 Tax=Exophiala viscosa TaxID=2486360 RepID=UPI002192CC23|nr:Alpha/Beta hydrolase protein [Exophiala viscosa]